jgi:hypothetical protein
MGGAILHPREQCLERGKETASNPAGGGWDGRCDGVRRGVLIHPPMYPLQSPL